MGREAACEARWGARAGRVSLHLDARSLAVRGAVRVTVALAELADVRVDGDALRFRAGDEAVSLDLGADVAARWAAAIATPPPSLARKLGIDASTRIAFAGPIDDDELAAAVSAGTLVDTDAAVALVRADDAATLARALAQYRDHLRSGRPLWVIYEKGRRSPLGETAVRDIARAHGLVDTKVASVSARLTAARFIARA